MFRSDYLQEKALAKLNLNFRVLRKLSNGLHEIQSHVVFLPKIYDFVEVKTHNTNIIELRGKYAKELYSLGGDTIIKKTLQEAANFFSIKINLKIILYKNIPLGSGLGGGSADAAAIFRILLRLYKIKVKKQHIIPFLLKIGSDVPACFFSQNILVGGYGNKIRRIVNVKEKKWVLVIKPFENHLTSSAFSRFKGPYSSPINFKYNLRNILSDMNIEPNALQRVAEKNLDYSYFIKNLPIGNSILPPRMTGSGSALFLLFDSFNSALENKRKIISTNKNIWLRISNIYL